MMILICHALMQVGFCWVETSLKDDDASYLLTYLQFSVIKWAKQRLG